MPFSDYHLHCSISPDSGEDIRTMCESAIERGLDEVMFTDHFEFFHSKDHSKVFNDSYLERQHDLVMETREEYRGRLFVGYGIEMGQSRLQAGWASSILSSYPFDFVLSSVHKIDDVDLYHHAYDVDEAERDALLDRYLDALYGEAAFSDYDSLAHIDLVRRYSSNAGYPLSIEKREEKVRKILKCVAMRGKALEVNTSGLRSKASQTIAGATLLSWFREEGGRYITIGSDSHDKDHIAYGFDRLGFLEGTGLEPVRFRERRIIREG